MKDILTCLTFIFLAVTVIIQQFQIDDLVKLNDLQDKINREIVINIENQQKINEIVSKSLNYEIQK